jgi:hypothetical protein
LGSSYVGWIKSRMVLLLTSARSSMNPSRACGVCLRMTYR